MSTLGQGLAGGCRHATALWVGWLTAPVTRLSQLHLYTFPPGLYGVGSCKIPIAPDDDMYGIDVDSTQVTLGSRCARGAPRTGTRSAFTGAMGMTA